MLYLLLWSWCLVQAFDGICKTASFLWYSQRIIGLPSRAQTVAAIPWQILSYVLTIYPLELCAEFSRDPSLGFCCVLWLSKFLFGSICCYALLWIYRGRFDELLYMPASARYVGGSRRSYKSRPQPYGLKWTGILLLCQLGAAEIVSSGTNFANHAIGSETAQPDTDFSWSCGTQLSFAGGIDLCHLEDHVAQPNLHGRLEPELQMPGDLHVNWFAEATAPHMRRANSVTLDDLAGFEPRFEEHMLCSGERQNDELSLMQNDLVSHRDYLHDYAFSVLDTFITPVRENRIILRSYFHAWRDRGRSSRNYKEQILLRSQPFEGQVYAFWAEHVNRQDLRIVPIRPLPNLGMGQVPVVLVVDHDDEHVLPLLFDYTSDARVFTASGWCDCTDGYPEMRDLFDLLVPENLCRTESDCIIRANGRQYLPGREVPLYEGIFIFLIEENLDDTDTQQSVSTIFGTATGSSSREMVSSDASVLQQGEPSVASVEAGIVNDDYYYFDIDDHDRLIIVGTTIEQETVYRIFQNIATVSTHFDQVGNMLFEARTFQEAMQRRLRIVFVIVGNEWFDGGQLDLDDDVISEWRWLASEIRWILFDHFPPHVHLDLWSVVPNLPPTEQEGNDDYYVLVDYDCPANVRVGAVIISDPEEPDFERLAIRLQPQMTDQLLYQLIAKTVKCMSSDFFCSVEHAGRAFMPGSFWHTFHGMKIDVRISERRFLKSHQRTRGPVCTASQMLLQRASELRHEAHSDEQSLMQFFQHEAFVIAPEAHTIPLPYPQSHYGVLYLHPDDHATRLPNDLLRSYLTDRKGPLPGKSFVVHTWMLDHRVQQVTNFASRCVLHPNRSHSESLLALWGAAYEKQELSATLVHPDMQPLMLRAFPLDLIVFPESGLRDQLHVYLIDLVGMQLPRRLAVLAGPGDTMAMIAMKIGVHELCILPYLECELTHSADGLPKWTLPDVVNAKHGSGLVLWMHPKGHQTAALRECTAFDEPGQDSLSLMQISRGPQRLLSEYVRDFTLGNLDTTWWIHDVYNELVQVHPDICHLNVHRDVEFQCREIWIQKGLPEHCRITPIDPPPIFIALPRPHLVVTATFAPFEIPILCHVTVDGHTNLLSLIIDMQYPPIGVAAIFALAVPQNDCQQSECYLIHETRKYEYWHDIELAAGAFVRISEWRREMSDDGSTMCASSSSPSLDDSWSMEYTTDTLLDTYDVPESSNEDPHLQDRDNTATLGVDSDAGDMLSFMQRTLHDTARTEQGTSSIPGESSASNSEMDRTAAGSSYGSLPPPMTAGVNHDFDWITTWGRVRSHITLYARAPDRPAQLASLRVHLLSEQQGQTASTDAQCPTGLLHEHAPICWFSAWCETICFAFTDESTRAFPVLHELIQNTPSILVVQTLWPGQVPLVVLLSDQVTPLYYVYHAFPYERVAGLIDWLEQQIQLMLPYTLTYRGHRVESGHDIPISAGEVLFVNSQTWQEHHDPLPITAEPEDSLVFATHSTWQTCLPTETIELSQDDDTPGEVTLQPQRYMVVGPPTSPDTGGNTATPGEGDETTLFQMYNTLTAPGHSGECRQPRLVKWRVLSGMKLNLETTSSDPCDKPLLQPEGDDDYSVLMQRAMDINTEIPTFLMQLSLDPIPAVEVTIDHRARCHTDPVYALISRAQDPHGLMVPPGRSLKAWLLPSEGLSAHDTVVRFYADAHLPDWSGHILHSWRQCPDQFRFLLLPDDVPRLGEDPASHVIGTSQRDHELGVRAVMIDLTYSSVLRRGVVRCGILATVAEITRMFSGTQIPIDSPLLATFQLIWHDGSSYRRYSAFEVPEMPEGSFVRILQNSNPCSTEYIIQMASKIHPLGEDVASEQEDLDRINLMRFALDHNALRHAQDPLYRVVSSMRRLWLLDLSTDLLASIWVFMAPDQPVVQAPRWHRLAADSLDWMADTGLQPSTAILAIQPRPPPGEDTEDLAIMAFEQADWRYLLIDLIQPLRTTRYAVQVSFHHTVLEIFREIASNQIALKSLLTTSMTMSWAVPEGAYIFRSYEIPSVPSGSYVTLRVTDTVCLDEAAVRDRFTRTHDYKASVHEQGDNTATPEQEEHQSMLQISVHRRPQWNHFALVVPIDPFRSLPPPGNTVFWLSKRFFDLDNYFCIGDDEYVVDAGCELCLSNRPQPIQLASLLPAPRTISLSPSLPFAVHQAAGPSIKLSDFQVLLDMLFTTLPTVNVDWDDVLTGADATIVQDFANLDFAVSTDADRYILYTDGSHFRQLGALAGWSLVVFAEHQQKYSLLHADYGTVQIEPMQAGWTGAVVSNSRSAEAEALIRAIEWVFQADREIACVFRFDAESVGFAGTGQYGINANDRQFRLLRSLTEALRTFLMPHATTQWEHVQAHTGEFGNELADCLAKYACRHQAELRACPRPDYVPYLFGPCFQIEMLWLYFTQFHCHPKDPPILNNHLEPGRLAPASGLAGRIPEELIREDIRTKRSAKFNLFAVTYNVATLGQNRGAFYVQYLREQACAHRIDALFLQETRSKKSQLISSATHFRILSGSDKGHGGLEIWLARRHTGAQTDVFRKEMIWVLYASPELLVVKAKCKGVELLLVNGHAPHSGRGETVIQDFWKHLTEVLDTYSKKYANIICGVDANAHFASAFSDCIGDFGLEQMTTLGGICFGTLLQRFRLYAPSTYEHHHAGEHHTWHGHANGQGARCDYFAVPAAWCSGYIRTYLMPSLDAGGKGLDHTPLAMELQIFLVKDISHSRTAKIDRQALLRADAKTVETMLENLAIPAWTEDIDRHFTSLSQQIERRLVKSFPKVQQRPKKSYISDESWGIRKQRMQEKWQLAQIKVKLDLLLPRAAFESWNRDAGWNRQAYVVQVVSLFRQAIESRRRMAALNKQLTGSLRHDRTRKLEEIAELAGGMRQRDFFDALRAVGVSNRKKPSAIQPLPMLRQSNGMVVDTLEELTKCWRTYFANQEDGREMSLNQLMDQVDQASSRTKTLPAWDEIPSLFEIERRLRRNSQGRSYFVDNLPGELLAKAPAAMAKIFFSGICKEIIFQKEPLLHKGGFLVPAYKKGDPTDPTNYRSLFVSSVIGKAVHGIFREKIAAAFMKQRLPFQIGGLKEQNITQATHALQIFHRNALREHDSVAILFVDVSNAFYCLVRQHIVHGRADTRTPRQLFQQLKLPEEAIQDFELLFETPDAVSGADLSPFVKEMFQEFYESTWFKLKGDRQVVNTRRGSRPGDSMADICFSYALTKIIHEVLDKVRVAFPSIAIPWNGKCTPFPLQGPTTLLDVLMPIWADDLALAIRAPDPELLIQQLKAVSGELFDGLISAGLTPNFRAGKTEVLLDIRGQGSLAMRRTLHFAEQQLTIPSKFADYQLQCVGTYKHLGTWLQVGAGLVRDVQTKFAAAHSLLTQYKNQIFTNRKLPLIQKKRLFDSLVLSTIVYNAAIWRPRNKRQAAQIESSFTKLYKRIAAMHFGPIALDWGRTKVLDEYGLPSHEEILCQARLRYLEQLTRVGEPQLWALLQEDEQWRRQVFADLDWIRLYCADFPVFVCTPPDWDRLLEWIRASPIRWKRMLKSVMARCASARTITFHWKTWHSVIMVEVIKDGYAQQPQNQCRECMHYCLRCKKVFSRRAFLAVHAFKCHARVNRARLYVQGTGCEACLKEYDSYTDLVNHVKRSKSCLTFYADRGNVVEQQPGVNSRAANKNKKPLKRPFLQAEGPKCPPPEVIVLPTEDDKNQLFSRWDEAVAGDFTTVETCLERLRVATLDTCLFHEEILECFHEWNLRWTAQHEECTVVMLRVFYMFQQCASAEWFIHGSDICQPVLESALEFFEREAWKFQDIVCHPPREVPYKPRTIAHLFSGDRRSGDLQEHLEALGLKALSIDVIFDVEFGNLLRQDTLDLFIRALRGKQLLGFMAGPPCETWSRARHVQAERGPRPVRSVQRLQGETFLTKKEAEQVALGNRLLAVTFRLLWTALVSGCTGVVEHPAMPPEPEYPSIWKMPLVKLLLRFTNCHLLRVEQGRYGGLSSKPTDLLIVNGTGNDHEHFVSMRTTELPRTGRIGRDASGGWKTSVLKQYPPDFCRALARLFDLAQPESSSAAVLPEWFETSTRKLVAAYNLEAPMGPDYCPEAMRCAT